MKFKLYITNMRENDSREHKKAEQILVHKRSFDIEHDLNYEHLTILRIK